MHRENYDTGTANDFDNGILTFIAEDGVDKESIFYPDTFLGYPLPNLLVRSSKITNLLNTIYFS